MWLGLISCSEDTAGKPGTTSQIFWLIFVSLNPQQYFLFNKCNYCQRAGCVRHAAHVEVEDNSAELCALLLVLLVHLTQAEVIWEQSLGWGRVWLDWSVACLQGTDLFGWHHSVGRESSAVFQISYLSLTQRVGQQAVLLRSFCFTSCPDFIQWWPVTWKRKPNEPFPILSCFWSVCLTQQQAGS